MAISIRKAEPPDFDTIWPLFNAIVSAGAAYPYEPTTTKQGYQLWMEMPLATFIAEKNGETVGTYNIKPNHSCPGAHICNCSYMVANSAGKQGLATALCERPQHLAIKNGFLAMQFNLVVSTNTATVYLWQKLGFSIIGTTLKTFNHKELGLIDAHILHKQLIHHSDSNSPGYET